ncbi:hypothetical protein [Anaerosolibacter sp.]|uniref:hypothetical protein n=1 Tax=Anaerosolibacter sp. TaxID=1872527 RepID=UPI0039F126F6
MLENVKKKDDNKKSIEELGKIYDFEALYNDKIYHNTKLLLKLYSKVLWRMSNSIMEMEAECYLTNGSRLFEVVDVLIDVDPRVDKARIESRLQSIEDSKSILELIDRALILLKNYPIDGERYYEILSKSYLVFVKYSEGEILESMNMSRSTFFRDKKKAVTLLGVILWGFVIPDIKKSQTKK